MRYFVLAIFIWMQSLVFGQKTFEYPRAPKDTTFSRTYHDTTIYDPYHWMEDPTDPRLEPWLEEQYKLTEKLDRKQRDRGILHSQIAAIYHNVYYKATDEYNRKKETDKKEKYEFKFKKKKNSETPSILYKKPGETVFQYLMKVKDFRYDKEDNIEIVRTFVHDSSQIAMIRISHSGSDWEEAYFFHLPSKTQLQDTLKYLRAGSNVVWHNNGVYYDHYAPPQPGRELLDKAKGQTLKFHKIGTQQHEDRMMYYNPDTTGLHQMSFHKLDSNYLIIYHKIFSRGKVYNAIGQVDLRNESPFMVKDFLMLDDNGVKFEAKFISKDTVWLESNWDAPNGKVYISFLNQVNKVVEFVSEADVPLKFVNKLGNDKLVCGYSDHYEIYNHQGELLKTAELPANKTIKHFYEYDPEARFTEFCLSSFYHPDLWYQMNLETLEVVPSDQVTVPYKYSDLETRLVDITSKDGEKIPMYITCKKDVELDGTNPTLIYGYGGYGITVEPRYNPSQVLFVLHGGILAIPNIRGGGAKGDDWAREGRRLKKKNAINDFISAAEYLIEEGYTVPDKIGIMGGSHGGMLVAAAAVSRPDLFKAVVAEAGPYDMLNKERFGSGGVDLNINEYGTVKDPDDFKNLVSYSPLHQIKKNQNYPDFLVVTGDTDDRVPPLHSYKFVATLQEKANPAGLYHLYVIQGAGHAGALTISDSTNKILYSYYFLFEQLGIAL